MSQPRALPAVGTTLERAAVRELAARWPRALVTEGVRAIIAAARSGGVLPASDPEWSEALTAWLDGRTASTLRPAINATGVILHTNLGRAPLAQAALDAVATIAAGSATLEYDVGAGTRGSRHAHCAALLTELTGAEDAIVVNNCAAGLVLALQALAAGREALVSRGELVEIGGSFRVPEIMAASGTSLVEVGTTNRTHVADYRRALGPSVAAIVKVHRSNFTQDGFVAEATVPELVPIAAEANVPLIHDFGSGLMLDLSAYGLAGEPTAADAVRDGASIVIMSGDKLLGGPQAGIVLGTREAVATLRQHPMARALRVDKLTLAALEATLALYRDPERLPQRLEALRLLTRPEAEIRAQAERLLPAWQAALAGWPLDAAIAPTLSQIGSGSLPVDRLPSVALVARPRGKRSGVLHKLEAALRRLPTPVIGHIADDALRLDLRCLPPDGETEFAAQLSASSGLGA